MLLLCCSNIDNNKFPGTESQRIKELKNQLVEQGYDPLEVDCLITMHIEKCEVEGLNQDQFKVVVKALEQLLSIARNFEESKN